MRPAATSAAARRRVSARAGARSNAASSAGASAATAAGDGQVAQAGAVAAHAVAGDQPALDLDRALELDQLLAHRGQQRLPRHRRAPEAHVRGAPHRPADHRVVAERVVERAQVVVDAGGEAHPPDAPHRVGLRRRAGAEDHAAGRGLDHGDVDRPVAAVQQPLDRRAAPPRQPVGRAAREPERPGRGDLDAELVLHAPGFYRSTAAAPRRALRGQNRGQIDGPTPADVGIAPVVSRAPTRGARRRGTSSSRRSRRARPCSSCACGG